MPEEFAQVPPSTFQLRRKTRGSFLLVPCPRLGRSIRCQGQLQAAAATILGACPSVVSLREQPPPIAYLWRATAAGLQVQWLDHAAGTEKRPKAACRASRAAADFYVTLRGDAAAVSVAVKIERLQRLARPAVQRRLAVLRAYAAEQRWRCCVLTERELLHGPLLANLRLLARYRKVDLDLRHVQCMMSQIERGPATIAALGQCLPQDLDPAARRSAVFHLLAAGQLDFDPSAAMLSDETLVYPGGAIPWDPFDSVWAPSGCSTDEHSGSFASPPPINTSPMI